MKRPKQLTEWVFREGQHEEVGIVINPNIEPTTENFNILINEYNNLVEVVNTLLDTLEPTGIVLRRSNES